MVGNVPSYDNNGCAIGKWSSSFSGLDLTNEKEREREYRKESRSLEKLSRSTFFYYNVWSNQCMTKWF